MNVPYVKSESSYITSTEIVIYSIIGVILFAIIAKLAFEHTAKSLRK